MHKIAFALCAVNLLFVSTKAAEDGDPARGEQFFRACAACHSLSANHNMTGPSLAGVFGRKAGALASFQRYSPAMKSSDVTWNEQALNAWLTKPDDFIPGSRMTFQGIGEAQIRADIRSRR
jgi:cytochrome c